jgi:hypothetical protein
MTEQEASAFLKIPVASLRSMRARKPPPRDPIPFVKIGQLVRYRTDQLQKWIERNTFFDTGDASAHRSA